MRAERSFKYPGIQKGWHLDMKIDAVMDEMDDGKIVSPIKIVRHYRRRHCEGAKRSKIYSPVDD